MKVLTAATATTLVAIGGMHLVWTATPWPLASRADLAREVVGRPDQSLPAYFVPASIGVGLGLGGAGYLVAVSGGLVRSDLPGHVVTIGTRALAGILLARAAGGFVTSGAGLGDAPNGYRRRDLRAYSPLCLALGAAVVRVSTSGGRGVSSPGAGRSRRW